MDQNQDQIDPEVAQEVISLLNKKITNLRNENYVLQSELNKALVKAEEEGRRGTLIMNNDTQRLLDEIGYWKSELERRPDPGEVLTLEDKLKKTKQRRQESEQSLRSQVEHLRVGLEETESARQQERAVKEALEREIDKLCNDLNERTREKEEALAQLESQQSDNFNVRLFLRGELEKLPPMPNPIVVATEGKPRSNGVFTKTIGDQHTLFANGIGAIKWANKGGGCVVPSPPVIYNGKKHLAEQSRQEIIENRSYELFGVDGLCVYYGTYRCTKIVSMDWSALKSLGQEFVGAFLEAAVVQDGLAAPVIESLIKNMYETNILKAGCAVLRCEGFDNAILKKVQSANGPPRIRELLIHNGGKRPNGDHKSGQGSQGASKKPRLRR